MYTTEQYAKLAHQLSDALGDRAAFDRMMQTLRDEKRALESQVEELFSTIAALQVENAKLKQIAKYE